MACSSTNVDNIGVGAGTSSSTNVHNIGAGTSSSSNNPLVAVISFFIFYLEVY